MSVSGGEWALTLRARAASSQKCRLHLKHKGGRREVPKAVAKAVDYTMTHDLNPPGCLQTSTLKSNFSLIMEAAESPSLWHPRLS
jgi:hypothetical protein